MKPASYSTQEVVNNQKVGLEIRYIPKSIFDYVATRPRPLLGLMN